MVDLASLGDVEGLWRPLTADEQRVAYSLIAFASAIVRRDAADVDERLEAGTLDRQLVSGVVASMVLRVLRNPDGKVSESIDDYAYRRADPVADGALYLSAGELALLAPRRKGGAFSVKPDW